MAKKGHFRPFWAFFFGGIRTRTWNWVNQAWISVPLGNAHILRPNLIGATGLALLTPLNFELEILIPQTVLLDVPAEWIVPAVRGIIDCLDKS